MLFIQQNQSNCFRNDIGKNSSVLQQKLSRQVGQDNKNILFGQNQQKISASLHSYDFSKKPRVQSFNAALLPLQENPSQHLLEQNKKMLIQQEIKKKFILIKRIDHPFTKNPISFIFADRLTLQIIKQFQGVPTQSGYNELLLRKSIFYNQEREIIFTNNKNKTDKNRIECVGKEISSRHLKFRVSEGEEKSNRSVTIFILCWKKCSKASVLHRVPFFLIKNIVQYTTQYNKYFFELEPGTNTDTNSLVRKSSIQGAFISLTKPIQICTNSKRKDEYRLNTNFDVKLKPCKIFNYEEQDKKQASERVREQLQINEDANENQGVEECKLLSYKERVLNYIRMVVSAEESRDVTAAGIEQFKKIRVQDMPTDRPFETLIIKMKTLVTVRFHILTTIKTQYSIGNGDFDVHIAMTSLPRQTQQALIRYQSKKWYLKSCLEEGIWVKLKKSECVLIRDKTIIRLDNKTYFEITMDER